MELTSEQMNQAQVLEKGLRESESQIEFINNQLSELNVFYMSLDSFSKSENNKILASIGRGVFADANLTSKELFVEVGKGVILKKNPEQVKEILAGQIRKLSETRAFLQTQIDFYMSSLQSLINLIET